MRMKTTLDELMAQIKAVCFKHEHYKDFVRIRDRLEHLDRLSRNIEGGYLLRIVWDEADGYPEHAWGYEQYTVRPYIQSYGCDGTTDANIHLIACELCDQVGIDYARAYVDAYSKDSKIRDTRKWIAELRADAELRSETKLPEVADDHTLALMLADLYDMNNRSLVSVLEDRLEACGRTMPGKIFDVMSRV